jgi:hypothetical protein
MVLRKGADNHSPTRLMRVEFTLKIQAYSPVWRGFSPLSLTLSIFLASFFSDLASENTKLLAILASVLKKLIHTPVVRFLLLKYRYFDVLREKGP